MSGDVQPKKRKEKKRKKEDGMDYLAPPPLFVPNIKAEEDTNIHVHKDDGLGGGICAKIVFFLLFSALIVVIGLIIVEHRGLTELEKSNTESRFAQLFKGWTDDVHDNGHHDDAETLTEYENALDEDDHDEHDDQDDHDDHEDHDEASPEEETEVDADEEEEEEEENGTHEEDEEEEANEEEEEEEEETALSEEEAEQEDDEERSLTEEDEDDEKEEEEEEEGEEEEQEQEEEETPETAEEEEDEVLESDEQPEDDEDNNNIDNEDDLATSQQKTEDDEEGEEGDRDDQVDEAEESEEETDVKHEDVDADDTDDGYESSEAKPQTPPKKVKRETKEDNKIDAEEGDGEGSSLLDAIPPDVANNNQDDNSNTQYSNANITNKDDWQIREELDSNDKIIETNPAYALRQYEHVLERRPNSPRALYGKARTLDILAEIERSNRRLEQAVQGWLQLLLRTPDVPAALFEKAGRRCVVRARFLGKHKDAISVQQALIEKFPDKVELRNDLAVSYLTSNRINEARAVLKHILKKWPNNGFALVHYGFILKTSDNKLTEAVDFLEKGIRSKEVGVQDGRFYFHLGDALARLGRNDDAMKVYEEGVNLGLFRSKYQRSLYNVDHLRAKPWWRKEETPYGNLYAALEANYEIIYKEGLAVLSERGYFQDESENLRDSGEWKQFELFARGVKNARNCKRCPFTCQLLESLPDASGCKRGQSKFSVMHPGTHVWPHCGPTNCRLRVHLGLKVPEGTFIRVADETRSWKEGKILIFDDSFEHEVWHNGTDFRLVLIVDVWHPDLRPSEKRTLSPI